MVIRYVQVQPSVAVGKGTTGAATGFMPNNGLSIIGDTSSEVYVLSPPELGVKKTIVFTSSSTTITPTVRGSTAQTVTFCQAMGGNTALPTMFKLAATKSTNMNTVVELVGMSSTEWVITNVWPVMTTGNGGGSITLSTT